MAVANCGRTAQEQAAVRAQEACIAALGPVARDQQPSTGALASARRHADAAASADQRWVRLRDRVRELGDTTGQGGGRAVDAVVRECERVNRIVKEERGDI